MGKRSDFERRAQDFYPTPRSAVLPLIPHLPPFFTYAEPCCGAYDLCAALPGVCVHASDLPTNALSILLPPCDLIVTNPPWSRHILHPMIDHFRMQHPTWLLFDADWMHTKQARAYLPYCSKVVSVGRVKWMPDSKHTGKDNAAWYLFVDHPVATVFYNSERLIP